MKFRIIEGVIIGICLTALAASAKAIIDVAVLKDNRITIQSDVKEIKQDIKTIKTFILTRH
jgi:malate/lactate dehydrogenase